MTDIPRLYVFAPSHYCERARWALDYMGIAFVEECWAVGLHVRRAKRLAKGTSLPILHTREGVIQGSDLILDWTRIGGADPDLEARIADTIGVLVRQYIYSATLDDPKFGIRDLLFEGVPRGQARLGRMAWPITRRLMITMMNARSSLTGEIERQLSFELDWFDAQIRGRRHLVGHRLGRADITAASMLAPLAKPAACPLYNRDGVLPPRLAEMIASWSKRPGLQWTQQLYADHRHRTNRNPSETGVVVGGDSDVSR